MAIRDDITIDELITLRDALVRLQSVMAKYFQGQYMPPPVSSTELDAVETALADVASAIAALESGEGGDGGEEDGEGGFGEE